MGLEDSLLELLDQAHRKNASKAHVIGRAVNVQETTCDVERDNAPTIYDVRFHCIEDTVASRIVIRPKVGSYVLCGFIESKHESEQAEAFIEQCSEIDEVFILVGNKKYQVKSDGHLIAAGNDTLKDALILFIESVENIIVLKGRNPNRIKLAQAKAKLLNILK